MLRFFSTPPEVQAKLFELAVKVRALQAGTVGNAGHVATLMFEVMLEVEAFERFTRFTQRLVEEGMP